MDRRQFLTASVVGLGTVSGGCATVGGRQPLGATAELDDRGMEKHLRFEDGDNEVAVLSLDQMTEQGSSTDSFRFRIHVEHGTGADDRASTVEGFRFDLRAPPASVSPPANIYLQAPSGGLWPDLTFEEVDDRWTRVEADDTDEVGTGTMTLSMIVDPLGLPADEVGVRARVDISEGGITGTDYRLETDARFEPVLSE